MQKIRRWLLAGRPFWMFLCALPVLVFFCWHFAKIGRNFVIWIAPNLTYSGTTRNYALELKQYEVHEIALRSFVMTPLREEFLYRVLPFGCVWLVWRLLYRTTPPLSHALALVIGTSIMFGYIHGGPGNIFIQGPIGVVIALVFLVWGSYGKTPLRGVAAILLLHGSYNFYIAMTVKQHFSA